MKHLILFACMLVLSMNGFSQQPGGYYLNDTILPMRDHMIRSTGVNYSGITQAQQFGKKGTLIFDTTQWAYWVDSTWGMGLSTADKLNLLDFVWHKLDSGYPCFVQLPMYNWDSLINDKRMEITNGVSKGRFAAIMHDLMCHINDGHSHFFDAGVQFSPAWPGKPLFRGETPTLGACITPLHDSTALVYEVVANQPFGLQRGDIILGYNNIAWKNLVALLLRHQLPNAVYQGSTPQATWHRYMQSALANWHLFDTINIRKCDGSLKNYSTSLMQGYISSDTLLCVEQMPVPGVKRVTYNEYVKLKKNVTYGMVTGTRIGYIYLYDCSDITGDSLRNIVIRLVEDSVAQGLIIDIRKNYGGSIGAYMSTFKYLHDGDVTWVGYGTRSNPADRYSMTNTGPTSWYDLLDNDPHVFGYPIAVITGPNAVSAGDFLPLMFKHDIAVKTFGKSTAGAYGSYRDIPLQYTGFYASMQPVNFYEAPTPNMYLSHTAYPVDVPIWFTADSVCTGTDNIASCAIQWIQTGIATAALQESNRTSSVRVFPNPSKGNVQFEFTSMQAEKVHIVIYSAIGKKITEWNENLPAGNHVVHLPTEAQALPDGNYFVSIKGTSLPIVKKLVICR